MYGSMMDYMKQYPPPSNKIVKENIINDTLGYRKNEFKKGYHKIVKNIATKLLKHNKSKDLSDYSIFFRVKLRDKCKKMIDNELHSNKKTKKKKIKKKKTKKKIAKKY